ncbi:MAG: hypothetical protein R2682_00870 [Pyrinomonadaceae bacterium]
MKHFLFTCVILVLASTGMGAPGDLDTTFGVSGGYILSDYFGAHVEEWGFDTAVQTDGKIVVVGRRYESPNRVDFLAARYNVDGTLDTTFSGDGVFLLNSSAEDVFNAIVIQADGKIVAVGANGPTSAFIVRLNTDGTLDTTFSNDGFQVVLNTGIALSVALQADSKIVLGAKDQSNGSIIIRLNTDGTLDTTFDADGILPLGPNHLLPYGLAIQTDGKIVVAGASGGFAAVRLLSSGALDTSFDGDGMVVTAVNGGNSSARSVVIQTDGKIILSGGGDPDSAIVRYNSDGSLDTSFDTDGIRIFNVNNNNDEFFEDLALQPDGKILAIAHTLYSVLNVFIEEDFTIIRFNADGSFDPIFDANGIVRSQWCQEGTDLFLHTDGKVVATGSQNRSSTVGDRGVCIQRFNGDGSVDTSLNFTAGDGIYKQTVFSAQEFTSVEAIAGLPNGKIMVAGWGQPSYQPYPTARLIRLNSNGTLDTTFMNEGLFEFRDATNSTYFYDIESYGDGSFVVVGDGGFAKGGVVVKFTANGALDTTFSGDGIFTDNTLISRIYGVVVQPDGKIVGCGSNGNGVSIRQGKIFRLLANGTLDDDAFSNFGNTTNHNEIFDCALDSNNKLVVVGYGNDGTSDFVGVSRKVSSLANDVFFGVNGIVTTDLSPTLNERGTEVIVQPDNRVVVSSTGFGTDRDFAVLRYTANGMLDPNLYENFGSGGISLIDFVIGNPNDEANALLLQPDGRILSAGVSDNAGNKRFAIAKLNSDGSLLAGFGTLGRVVTPFPNNDAQINALSFFLNDKVLAAGKTWNGTDYDFAIVRYRNQDLVPTAATVSVSGRVFSTYGRPVFNALVTLTDLFGNIRRARTNQFGYFYFDEVASAETYIVQVRSKTDFFSQQIITPVDSISDLDFHGVAPGYEGVVSR